ncbi:IclR family transcriptional regulator [Pandoraea sputorum]|uniref:IclR family transcriptional regulator n=1 Tax=Pandoraea sputorum TaxID=93222 RepID=A0A5E5AW67_9BURK|nr:IclR family transcriptional regulator [Pandoraea sputorum]VVE76410.1 IclR family transcriptional regulator [Pandoraea sputorum]
MHGTQGAREGARDAGALDEAELRASDEARNLRALAVIERLAMAGQPYTLSQLATRLSIPKATLMRLIEALEVCGYVSHVPDSRGSERGLSLGPRAARLALVTLANNNFTRAARSLLRALVDRVGETVNLTALDGDEVLYIERVETNEPLRMQMHPGMRVPLHCTASGKLFLSQMPVAERRAVISRLSLKRMTPRTITDASLLEAELDRLAARGIDNEEFVRGMVAVGVPVRAPEDGHVRAVLAVHGPTARVTLEQLMGLVPTLRETATALAPLLDWQRASKVEAMAKRAEAEEGKAVAATERSES